ncbi:MAG: phage tail sheath family protein [Nitrosomonas sp.]|nr:phage tail sheath family protein [Nitrosomonas sp.]
MGQYLSPGVYVEEVPPLSKPIAGVGTSTPGFIGVITVEKNQNSIKLPVQHENSFGWTEYHLPAELGKAYKITSWAGFTRLFGDLVGSNAKASKEIITEGSGTEEKTYVTGIADPNFSITARWKKDDASEDKTTLGETDENGNFKVEVDKGITADKVTITTIIDSVDSITLDKNRQQLAHAVYGFFDNGGTGCYVIGIASASDAELDKALKKFSAIDEISMVAAPGMDGDKIYDKLISHCENLQDRVAILDSKEKVDDHTKLQSIPERPRNSTYSAFYFPWLEVSDPATSLIEKNDGRLFVPPSGHVAGVYARTDATRGVFKAPANEALRGVIGLKYSLSKADQESLNREGVNVIRPLIGAIRVWGARTVGGDANGEYRYISTRRYFNYLRESIDQGTQFVVFEPNSPALWERIKRTVGGFLLNEWRSGALFGVTPDQAFFVKCDAETNPPEVREAGRVVTEIGVAIVKPAEFVIFRIQQTSGG